MNEKENIVQCYIQKGSALVIKYAQKQYSVHCTIYNIIYCQHSIIGTRFLK